MEDKKDRYALLRDAKHNLVYAITYDGFEISHLDMGTAINEVYAQQIVDKLNTLDKISNLFKTLSAHKELTLE